MPQRGAAEKLTPSLSLFRVFLWGLCPAFCPRKRIAKVRLSRVKTSEMKPAARFLRLATLVVSFGVTSLSAQTSDPVDEPAGSTGGPVYGGTLVISSPTWSGGNTLVTGLTLAPDATLWAPVNFSGVSLANSSIVPAMAGGYTGATVVANPTTSTNLVGGGSTATWIGGDRILTTNVLSTSGSTLTLSSAATNAYITSGATLITGVDNSTNVLSTSGSTLTLASGTTAIPATSGASTGATLTITGSTTPTNVLINGGAGTLTLATSTNTTSSSGALVLGSPVVINGINSTAGTLTLSQTGASALTGGTALVTTQNIAAGGTLSLPLTISSGTVSLQNATTLNSSLQLQNNATLSVSLGNGTAGSGGSITVAGDVVLSGNLAVAAPANLPVGSSFVILNKTSAGIIAGRFSGQPQGSIISLSGNDFVISYTGGDGNDVTLTALSKAQAWRQAHFGTVEETGAAADTADADADGIPNLIERACLLDPAASSTLPVSTARSGASLEYNYQRSVAAVNAGDLFTVEWSDSLTAATWSSIGVTQEVQSDDGTVQHVKATVPAGSTGQRFIRLKITPAP